MNRKLVIFDCYGVVVTGGFQATCNALAEKFNRNAEELYRVIYTKYFQQEVRKEIPQDAFWEKALQELTLPISVKELKELHFSFVRRNMAIIHLVRDLAKETTVILLTSNTPLLHEETESRVHIEEFFEQIINTFDLGFPKASIETFQHLLKQFHVKPGEVIFVDDCPENLAIPKQLGIHTILYGNFADFMEEFNKVYG